MNADPVITAALERGQKALSEHDSKVLMEKYGIPVVSERLAANSSEAVAAAGEIGYPVVLKACGPEISHKTERQLVAVGLKSDAEVTQAFDRITGNLGDTPSEGVLVQKMVPGERELVIGLIRDPQFGPCVMFGLGGIFTEILKDTSFRVAPITEEDASQMMDDIRAKAILGPVRGMAPADRGTLARALVGLGTIGMEQEAVAEIDVNPLIIGTDGVPVAVDALVILSDSGE
ncbi:MAG: acetate--CoA ligase family protein [Actinobacteria bacterium]|nr:acetate--CoA ligase family protein [Actinomycetota bacterium]MBU1942707.1 acetate--CoA ligase family protein [Actinomycetota bacterium]MBU2686029.1 acetate--CoA ligase family protein [Actinomycetota bacterium]